VPTGDPVHYDSGPPPKRQHIVKLESYAGQGASFAAFLENYKEHSRYYQWNDDDRIFHLKNCLTGTAATVLWAGGKKDKATQLIALLQNQHGTANQLERFWLELYARKRKPSETLQDLYQDIRRLISLACSNDASETSERLAITQFTSAIDNENIRFEVLNKNPPTLESALHIAMRYEALKPDHSAPQRAPVTESSKGTDASAFIYNDKGLTKDSLRAHEIHVAPDQNMDTKYEIERACNDHSQRTILDLQRQLQDARSRQDEQRHAQAAYASGAHYTQAYATPQYQGASTQVAPYHSYPQAARYQTQNSSNDKKPNRGKYSQHQYKMNGAQQPWAPTPGTFCHTCGAAGHWRRDCPQSQPSRALRIMSRQATKDVHGK